MNTNKGLGNIIMYSFRTGIIFDVFDYGHTVILAVNTLIEISATFLGQIVLLQLTRGNAIHLRLKDDASIGILIPAFLFSVRKQIQRFIVSSYQRLSVLPRENGNSPGS